MSSRSLRTLAFVTGVVILGLGSWANADPPSRVARLGYMSGTVSFSPAGENDWVRAMINRPLTVGDRLWADADSRVEIQVGTAMIRMNAGTSVSLLNLDDRIVQLQLTQGVLNVRVRRLEPDQVIEIATPNLAIAFRQPGEYRIDVDPDGMATTIIVREGRGEVYGEGASYAVDARQPYRFAGTSLREYQYVDVPRPDEFDRWASDRDRRYDSSVSARYVSRDVIGYQDLDTNGTWRVDATYGNVWFPSRVDADWAPYRDGHWAWVDPWGWTWVDDAPWGFAVSHYGRWTSIRGAWGWVPGPVRTRAYYAPALVVFVGGDSLQLSLASGNVGGVAWFPLGPREVYRPSYPVSRGYFENVNRSNTVINTTVINNYYNNTNVTNVVYANRRVPGAVVAVPSAAFAQSQPVSRAAVRVRQDAIAGFAVAATPTIAPTARSVRGAAAPGGTPPPRAFERAVVARTAPPAAPASFAVQQRQLEAKPGRPLDDEARRQLKPAVATATATATAPVVRVVEQPQKAPQALRPPPAESVARPADERGKAEPRGSAERDMRGRPVAPTSSTQRTAEPTGVPPPIAAPPAASRTPSAPAPEQRVTSEQRDQRGRPVPPAPAPAPPTQRTAEPAAVVPPGSTPPAVSRPSIAQPPEQRVRSEPRDQRGQAVAPGPTTQRAAEPIAAPPPVSRPSAAQPVEQRGTTAPRGAVEQRAQPAASPPPQRTPERMSGPPPSAAPASATPSPQERTSPPRAGAPSQQRAPAAPVAQPPAQKAQPQPAQSTEPRDRPSKPAEGRSDGKPKDDDERKRDADSRKEKG